MNNPFRKRVTEEQRLLEHLGFHVILKDSASSREIIGIAQQSGRLNFFIQLIFAKDLSEADQVEQYSERLKAVKNQYSIEKDFLIRHQPLGKGWLVDIICNESFIKAVVVVTDPLNHYHYLGPIAICFHESQLSQMPVKKIDSLVPGDVSLTVTRLKQCPFLEFDVLERQFKFITDELQAYYIAQEFNQFGKGLYKGTFHQPLFHVSPYFDYSLAPAKLLELNMLFEKIEERKKVIVKQMLYEEAAMLRDNEKLLFEKWVVSHWWDYTVVDLDEAQREFDQLLNETDRS